MLPFYLTEKLQFRFFIGQLHTTQQPYSQKRILTIVNCPF